MAESICVSLQLPSCPLQRTEHNREVAFLNVPRSLMYSTSTIITVSSAGPSGCALAQMAVSGEGVGEGGGGGTLIVFRGR